MHWKEKAEAILGVIFCIVILGAFFGWPDKIITLIIQWGTSLIVGVVLSGVSGELVERLTGDVLRNITITVPIAGYNFSITLFFIVTIIVRYWLF